MTEKLEIPNGIQASVNNNVLNIKGKSESIRAFPSKKVKISTDGNKIILSSEKPTQREKRMLKTFKAHIKNMFKGVSEGHIYRLKICSGHFPMNVSVNNNVFVVKNFLGEKSPRTLKLDADKAKVKIEGDIIIVEGDNKEKVGQTAANIEQLTRIANKDRRIFQDGIYLIEKDGKII